ncbi:Uncharacterized protein TCM_008875 [Theobroma cacao]|uniref:Uncharacterized protein n=1 Tax=Theobroma cacao TaxID=3641 RepID=A0A061E5I0_THECC|nr:Uncharacterized protein TCM_008875 [Theobroma cacao]
MFFSTSLSTLTDVHRISKIIKHRQYGQLNILSNCRAIPQFHSIHVMETSKSLLGDVVVVVVDAVGRLNDNVAMVED